MSGSLYPDGTARCTIIAFSDRGIVIVFVKSEMWIMNFVIHFWSNITRPEHVPQLAGWHRVCLRFGSRKRFQCFQCAPLSPADGAVDLDTPRRLRRWKTCFNLVLIKKKKRGITFSWISSNSSYIHVYFACFAFVYLYISKMYLDKWYENHNGIVIVVKIIFTIVIFIRPMPLPSLTVIKETWNAV